MAKTSRSSARTDPADAHYPIRTVSTLTGVNAVTLRAWERRYGLLRPIRSATGHRLYTQKDVELIHKLVQLLDSGIPISQARKRLQQEFGERTVATQPSATPLADTWARYQQHMISAVSRFDQERLESTYNEALSLYPVDIVTAKLILPLLRALGQRWETAQGSVAEEHFFSAYLRNKLGARLHHLASHRHGPKIVAACLPGEFHEVGLLLFCLSAAARDYRIILLGANMPLEELPLVMKRSQSQALILSGGEAQSTEALERGLKTLTAAVRQPVFVGGVVAARYHDALVRAGVLPVGDDISHALRRIDEALGHGAGSNEP